MKLKQNYVYVFECLGCYFFYGDQKLNIKGKLLCPNCGAPEDLTSPYVERVAVK